MCSPSLSSVGCFGIETVVITQQPYTAPNHVMTPDRKGLSLSTAVLERVAQAKGIDTLALPSLDDAVDPDALDALYAPKPTGAQRTGSVTVTFMYAGCTVVIHDSNSIRVLCSDSVQ